MRNRIMAIVASGVLVACGTEDSNSNRESGGPVDAGVSNSFDAGSTERDMQVVTDSGSKVDMDSPFDTGGTGDLGSDIGGDAAMACTDGETRISQRSCGLNDRGSVEEVCAGGAWEAGPCIDPDDCTDGEMRPGTTPCGLLDSGLLSQICIDGTFEDSATCEGAYVCAPNETTLSSVACGDFMAGRVLEQCDASGAMLTPLPDTCVFPGLTVPDFGQIPGTGSLASPMAISGDGRFVLAGIGTNNSSVLLHDRHTGLTEAVNITPTGAIGDRVYFADVSDDGRYTALETYRFETMWGSDNNGSDQVWLRDRMMGTTVRASQGLAGDGANDHAKLLHLSPDGARVLFHSSADNLVAGDTNGTADLFVYYSASGTVERVSTTSTGAELDGSVDTFGGLSDDGRTLVFSGYIDNLPGSTSNSGAWLKDLVTGTVTSLGVPEPVTIATMSGDGDTVFYNQGLSIWVWDRAADEHYELSSLDRIPLQISTDGRVFAMTEGGGDLDAVAYRWVPRSPGFATTQKRVLTVDQQGNALGSSGYLVYLSSDGNYVFFESSVGLLPGHTYGSNYVRYVGDL